MYPILLTVGPVTLYTLGATAVLAFLAGSFLFWRWLKDDLVEEGILVATLLATFGGLLGSQLGRGSGLSFLAALSGAVVIVGVYGRAQRWNLWDLVDPGAAAVLWVVFIFGLGGQFSGAGKTQLVGLPLSFWSLATLVFGRWVVKHYRSWRWYESGKVGLVGLSEAVFFFVGFLVVACFAAKQLYWGPLSVNAWVTIGATGFFLCFIYRRSGRDLKEDLQWRKKRKS